MAVLMFEKRFWEPIVSGTKVHSIRPTRKRPIVPGELIRLRGWEGAAYRSKQMTLCEEICIDVRNIWIDLQGIVVEGFDRIDEPQELDLFAQTDGFRDWNDMRSYRNLFYNLPFAGDFIQWGPNKFLAGKN